MKVWWAVLSPVNRAARVAEHDHVEELCNARKKLRRGRINTRGATCIYMELGDFRNGVCIVLCVVQRSLTGIGRLRCHALSLPLEYLL